jgi:hypothetical protein
MVGEERPNVPIEIDLGPTDGLRAWRRVLGAATEHGAVRRE